MKFSKSLYKVLLTFFLGGLAIIVACSQLDKVDNQDEAGVVGKINEYLNWEEQNGFSGIVTIKIKDDLYFSRSFGYANKEEGIRINENTVFDIGSLTKQFTAAAILKLEMEGKLKVSDSLSSFFPDIPKDKASISLHQLLTHTSGLRKSIGYDYQRRSKNEFLSKVFDSELISEPDSSYNYSHAGYSLLGTIIELSSGTTYEEYLKENLLDPAGLKYTGYVLPFWEEGQIAHGYRRCRDWGKPMDMPWASDGPYWNLKANGGLISSASDLMKWMNAIEGNDILSEDAKEKFFSPHVREGKDAGSFYSYGWMIAKSTRNTEVIAHDGDTKRFFTDILRYKTEDVTILVQSNLDKAGNENMSWELAKIIFWPDFEPSVQGSLQECMDSLPDSRIGEVAGDLIQAMNSKDKIEDTAILDSIFSDYIKNKHTDEHIVEVLEDLKSHFVNAEISRVIVTDYQMMEISIRHQEGEERNYLYIKLIFDEEDNYRIKMLMYDNRRR